MIVTTDADAKAQLALKCAAAVAPLLTDADLTALVAYAKRSDGTYNINRGAAEGWRWKAGRAAGGFSFSADGTKVDKTMIVDHCLSMVKAFTRGQVRTVVVDTGLAVGEVDYYPAQQ